MKHLVKYIVLFVLTALLVWGISWSRSKAESEICTAVDIEILNADNSTYVTPEAIKGEMTKMGLKAVGLPMSKINTDLIETKLRGSEYLETVECFISGNGHLTVRVQQIVPVLRVFDSDSTSFYMNRDGKPMAVRPNFHADVPIVSGNFSSKFPATRLLPLVEYIDKDSTLHSLVTMISVRDSNNIMLVPNIDGHIINLGSLNNFESKLNKLTAFYKNVLPHKGYNYYDTISVKWDHQIVATKRVKAVKVVTEIDPEDLEGDTPFEMVAGKTESEATEEPKAKEEEKPKADEKATETKKKNNN